MEKRKLVLTIIGVVILAMVIMVYIYFSKPGRDEKKNQQTINQVQTVQQKTDEKKENTEKNTSGDELENVTPGSEEYRGFLLDNVLHSPNEGDIHYNVYIPDAYDGTKEYALYVTLPGYQGLYFQGVGENIRTEDFEFEAQKYITDMIIVAPQLNDWGQTSADQTIELTQYFLTHYIINPSLGVRNYDVCIVAIGNNFQSSLETTSLLSELGARFVVSRAATDVQEKFLLRNGANEVVYPEKQLAKWTAIRYSADHILDYIELDENHAMFEIPIPKDWADHSIGELDIRKKFNINIMGIKKSGKLELSISSDTVLKAGDTMLALGSNRNLQKCFHT